MKHYVSNITTYLMELYVDHFTVRATDYYSKEKFSIEKYCVEKFTLELCHDKYFHMMPISYINKNNKVIVEALASCNCIELLEIAKNNGCNLYEVCKCAAYYGNLDAVKWGKKNKARWNGDVCTYAALNGDLETLQWAIANGCNSDYKWLCMYAAKNGHLNILEYLIGNGCKYKKLDCIQEAIMDGHTHIANWLQNLK
jgi:hypothetical protein